MPIPHRALACALLILTAAAVVAAGDQTAPPAEPLAPRLYAAYAAGDPGVIARVIRTRGDWNVLAAEIFAEIDRWKLDDRLRPQREREGILQPWYASRPAFIFELGERVLPVDPVTGIQLIHTARDFVGRRPRRPGQETAPIGSEDRFEVALHRLAVAALTQSPFHAETYLGSIAARLSALRQRPGGPAAIARLDLARGLLEEARTRPFVREDISSSMARTGAADRLNRSSIERAFGALNYPVDLPDIKAEIAIRRGFLAFRLDRPEAALPLLDLGLSGATDPVVVHWGRLFQGRVLEALGRPAEAVLAYEAALSIRPRAQTAAAALAVLLFTQGNRSAAEPWARVARSWSGEPDDPWLEYWYGDLRFRPALVAEIRGARP